MKPRVLLHDLAQNPEVKNRLCSFTDANNYVAGQIVVIINIITKEIQFEVRKSTINTHSKKKFDSIDKAVEFYNELGYGKV